MQIKEEKLRETRSFAEIWKSLAENEQVELRAAIIGRTGCTRQTIWNWATGETAPKSLSERRDVAQVVSKFTGRTVTSLSLFPSNR